MHDRLQHQAEIAVRLLTETLQAVFEKGQPADQFLKQYFRMHHEMGGHDRRLYSNLIFAVLRWYGPLHKNFADRELNWYLAGAMAAENSQEAVREKFPADESAGNTPLERLNSFFASCGLPAASERDLFPEWFFDHLDFEPTAQFYAMEQTRPPLWLRVQRGEVTLPEAQKHSKIKNALMILNPRINLPELEIYRTRQIEIQDLSSQCIGLTCAPKEGECWWDVCAGGGGKSMQLASIMHGKGKILASDVRAEKLEELKKRAQAAKFYNIQTRLRNGTNLPDNDGFDGVLVDAPCSSSGRWRRNPESRWTLTEKKISETSQLQHDILSSASCAVKEGGCLIYATCSLLKDENRMNVETFLQEHPDFQLETFTNPLSGEVTPGYLQILPEDGDCDAAFMARFRKKKG